MEVIRTGNLVCIKHRLDQDLILEKIYGTVQQIKHGLVVVRLDDGSLEYFRHKGWNRFLLVVCSAFWKDPSYQ